MTRSKTTTPDVVDKTESVPPDFEDIAPIAMIVTPLFNACAVNGCRGRVTEIVTVADQRGICDPDSLGTAGCCGERDCRKVIQGELASLAIRARVAHDYPGELFDLKVGPAVVLSSSDQDPS